MSGGVDSSVAAAMMKNEGFEVVGLTMQLGSCDSRCCSEQDVRDARRVARFLDIPHYVVSFRERFRRDVIDYFIEEYERGRTPNPCAVCNPKIKFGVLLDKALSLGARYIVTGHYAGSVFDNDSGRWLLKQGKDRNKDQSYFLARLTQEQLSRSLFPAGKYPKPRIRQMAEDLQLPVAQKTESQEVCFVPDTGVAAFIENERGRPPDPGPVIDTAGNRLGTHAGITGVTIGQRKGIGVAVGRPVYVTRIDAEANTVTVGDDPDLFGKALTVSGLNWIAVSTLDSPLEVRTRIRYRHRAAVSVIEKSGPDQVRVTFKTAQRAISPGQLAVFYDGDSVIGSGWIDGTDEP